MKKHFLLSSMAILMLLSAVLLTSCGAKELKLESNIKEQILISEAHFADVVYAKTGQVDFNTNTSPDYILDDKIFAKVATEVEDTINKLKIGEALYSAGVDVEVLVNPVSKVIRPAFKVEENILYVSSLIVFLNLDNHGKTMLSFPENAISPITIDLYENNLSLNANVKSRKPETLFEVSRLELEYNFQSDNPNNEFFVELFNRWENIAPSLSVLISTVANPGKVNQSSSYKFENPTKPSGEEKNGVMFFPGHNGGEDYTSTTPSNHKLIYTIYVPELGSRRITVNFENTFTPAWVLAFD